MGQLHGTTIHVVDDDKGFRDSLVGLLQVHTDSKVVGFDSGFAYLDSIGDEKPDCMIIDQKMPGMNGLEFQLELKRRNFNVPTILLSAFSDAELAVKAVKQGTNDVFKKPCEINKLLRAIEDCCNGARGNPVFSASPRKVSLKDLKDPKYVIQHWDAIAEYFNLSSRQLQIAQGICDSATNGTIGTGLFISTNTVRMHIKVLYDKVGVSDRVGLVLLCAGVDAWVERNGRGN